MASIITFCFVSFTDWGNFTSVRAKAWFELNKAWITRPNTSLLVVHYEHLKVLFSLCAKS